MKERLPSLVALLLLVSLVFLSWWAADYTLRSVLLDEPRRLTHEPDAWSQKFVMIRTNEAGVAINRLEGDYMVHYPDDDSYEIDVARAVGQRVGSPVTVATGNKAIMDKDDSRITLSGDAKLHRVPYDDRPALDVTSEQLILLPDEDVAYTNLPALVVNGKSRINGKGMRYDNDSRTLEVFSASDVKISGEESRKRSDSQNSNGPDTQTP
ncbi:LPS export ABC transporter periplasmic protein LptC [Pusillimonas sp. NJUB218]|uniref:LPS export ABC transporter periplasmic protein LptC n=1 Tax=Pusillimonas sp. NJUB218 TaxID=2023230 RepID=UPI000F4CBA4F|nr:LPS export ABC transporter periplasmic protein LptC [Pusillimonas sp. NJUB218]ROT44884.1 LPS export ABC transporter periplasmic protein LptC [Pusillimonas sp. NJUB218]